MKKLLNLDYYIENSLEWNSLRRKEQRSPVNKTYKPKDSAPRTMVLKQLGLQVTENCNLCCTYCYQLKKSPEKLTFDQCKKMIDIVLGLDKEYLTKYCRFELESPFCFHLIGGEPLLEDELCYKCIKYFETKLIENNIDIDWYIWIPSNGIPYFREYSQKIINEYGNRLDFAISMDGCKECHDACRIYKNGKGSYDDTRKAYEDFRKRRDYNYTGTKFTMSPQNIKYYSKSIIEWINDGIYQIFSNWELEDEYTEEKAYEYYCAAKECIDYIIDHDLEDVVEYSVLNRTSDHGIPFWNYEGLCGATGHQLALIPNGEIYSCVRLASTSLNDGVKPIPFGDLENGFCYTKEMKDSFNYHMKTTRTSNTNYKCYNCPINDSCHGCIGNDYNKFGLPFIKDCSSCNMYIADNLVRAYGRNKIYRKKEKLDKNYTFMSYRINVPEKWSIKIIGEEEFRLLKYLAKEKY